MVEIRQRASLSPMYICQRLALSTCAFSLSALIPFVMSLVDMDRFRFYKPPNQPCRSLHVPSKHSTQKNLLISPLTQALPPPKKMDQVLNDSSEPQPDMNSENKGTSQGFPNDESDDNLPEKLLRPPLTAALPTSPLPKPALNSSRKSMLSFNDMAKLSHVPGMTGNQQQKAVGISKAIVEDVQADCLTGIQASITGENSLPNDTGEEGSRVPGNYDKLIVPDSDDKSEDHLEVSRSPPTPGLGQFRTSQPLAPEDYALTTPATNANQDWAIHDVIGKEDVDGVPHYLVVWEETLLPITSLENAMEMVDEFEARLRSQRELKNKLGGKRTVVEPHVLDGHKRKRSRG